MGKPTSVEKLILMRHNGHVQIKNNNTYTYLIQHRGEVNDAEHMISVSHFFRYVVVGPKKNTT